jgi:transcriptional regulator with PAS, ATPase and Fis domain
MHKLSNRAGRPLVEINCSALPATLIESELFGHKKGSFTDAKEDKVGLFEMANGGIVFLDEIGDMDVKLQTKLLKAIEDRSIRRVGDVQNIKIDISIVAATNADLLVMVKEGKFRLDLYHRLNVIPLHIESLRQRREDIPLLIQHFLDIFSRKFRRKVTGFTPGAMARLMEYEWPGNVRELANVVERGCILTRSETIPEDYLLLPGSSTAPVPAQEEEITTLALMEERLIRSAMRKAAGNKGDAAKILGLHRSTLYKKLEDLGLL